MKDFKNKRILWISILFLIILLGVFAWKYLIPATEKKAVESITFDPNYYEGSVRSCAINPSFPEDHGLTPPYFIDLRQKGYRGLRIIEYKEEGQMLQLPSWSEYGWLGLYTLDRKGNIYLSPVPHESLKHNPLHEQNRILKLDGHSGQLSPFMDLPQAAPSTLRNPFGAMGLYFDCDNNSLYVSSVAGSDIKSEKGRIYQVDLKSKEIISQLDNVDAIGICTFNTKAGKRLFYGLARKAEIHSVLLDKKGQFTGESRKEFSLLEQEGGAFDKAHKITIKNNQMEIRANAFNFTLAASSDPQTNVYSFSYNRQHDKWEFIQIVTESAPE